MHNILFNGSKEAKNIFILAHGAGSPMDSHFMNLLALNMSSNNLLIIRFEFNYMYMRRYGARLFPDKFEKLLNTYIEFIGFIKSKFKNKNIWIGGKSLGGRVACQVSRMLNISGVIVYGYPFHTLKNPNNIRIDSLQKEGCPILIFQGSKDKMGNKNEIIEYKLNKNVKIVFFEDADHSFSTPKKSPMSQEEYIKIACSKSIDFIFKN